jgi:hypothetical protein
MTQTQTSNLELAPGCLACYTQGRLTFYWLTLTKESTLEQIEQALDVEEIHRRAKTPFLCGGEEVHIQDNNFNGGEYMSAKELFGYVQLLQLVPNFDYVRAFKEVFLMQDEFEQNGSGIQYEPSDMFKDFADSVIVFNYENEVENYLDEFFMEYAEMHNTPEIIFSFINWSSAREWIMNDYERAEVNNQIYLWRHC